MTLEQFLKKFTELRYKSPHLFSTSRENENCLYTEALAYSKNCYYVFTGAWGEDCYYGELIVKTKDCVDFLKIEQSELCYECTDCYQCYNSDFLVNCSNTRDSQYGFGLRDCTHCFLSSNQHHKSFIFKNRPYAKAEYETLVQEYKKTHSPAHMYGQFMELLKNTTRVNLSIIKSENCVGNYISHSKNIHSGFDILSAEDILYSEEVGYAKDCCDLYVGGQGELNYESLGIVKGCYNCSFCVGCITCVNCELCQTCYNLNDCFGCFYLKGKQYYILNQPYTAEEFKRESNSLRKALVEAKKFSLDLFSR